MTLRVQENSNEVEMICYLCAHNQFSSRPGQVRDAPALKILECENCGLVTLSSKEHIQTGFYENSGMHGDDLMSLETWRRDTEADDMRRYSMVKSLIANKCILDFGCGTGEFLKLSKTLAKE